MNRWMGVELLALGLTGVFRRPGEGFTMHRESGWVPIVAMLTLASPVELVLAHWLVEWLTAGWVAWLVTATSVYSLLWLWGDAQALRLHPTTVSDGMLHLRVGLRWQADVDVADVTATRCDEPAELDISVVGAPNVHMAFARPVTLEGPFGIRRTVDAVTVQMDDPAAFVVALG